MMDNNTSKKVIRVTAWYERIQEAGILLDEDILSRFGDISEEEKARIREEFFEESKPIKAIYPKGLMETLTDPMNEKDDIEVTVVDRYMPEYGMTDEQLENTDVLIWWAHITPQMMPDALAMKIRDRVLKGMGLILLHSSHPSKIANLLLGTSGSLKWRDDDYCRVWNINPTHPIAQGIPESIEIPGEEMYGEPFDIPNPEDIVFLSWFRGGEVFRSGCTWRRGYGKIFYFQPGHETNNTYHNPYVQKIVENAVRWAAPTVWRENFDCPHACPSPESLVE